MHHLTEEIVAYKNQHPGYSFSKIAKALIKEKKLKNSSDAFRKTVAEVLNKNVVKQEINLDDLGLEIELPPSWYKERPRFVIPESIERLLVLQDLHIPFHSNEAIKIALEYGRNNGIDGIYLNGDIGDFYGWSTFVRNPDYRNTPKEVELLKHFLKVLRDKFPTQKIYYKFGNHEKRFERHIQAKADELWGLIDLEKLLQLSFYNITYVDELTTTEFGRLNIIHGHEIPGSRGAVNLARNLRLKANDNLLFGHYHVSQEDLAKTIKGKILGSFAIGCLCGLSPDYMPINNWVNGFALCIREDEGYYRVKNKKIINGRIL